MRHGRNKALKIATWALEAAEGDDAHFAVTSPCAGCHGCVPLFSPTRLPGTYSHAWCLVKRPQMSGDWVAYFEKAIWEQDRRCSGLWRGPLDNRSTV